MILFFYGPNTFASRQKLRELVERYKKTTGADFGLERFDVSEPKVSPEQIVSAITSLPFLATNRLIIIEDLLGNKLLAKAVLEQLDRVPPENVVVFYEQEADERSRLFKSLKAWAKTAKFDHLPSSKLLTWVRKLVQELGGTIDPSTANYLINRVGNDQWRLYHELSKLINFNPQITREAIGQLVEPSFQQTIFDLVDTLVKGQVELALGLYRGLRAAKLQPLYILSMIGWGLRNLLVAQAAVGAGRTPRQLVADFGMAPFVAAKSLKAASSLPAGVLRLAHQKLVETDRQIKTSRVDPDLLLEQLIINLALKLKP